MEKTPPPFDPLTVATYIPDRAPQWKPHLSMARAKAAIATRTFYGSNDYRGVAAGQIWQHDGEEWRLVFDVERGTPLSDLPWKR